MLTEVTNIPFLNSSGIPLLYNVNTSKTSWLTKAALNILMCLSFLYTASFKILFT
jgi:formate-dependent nitrite reductase membrane component NrfD